LRFLVIRFAILLGARVRGFGRESTFGCGKALIIVDAFFGTRIVVGKSNTIGRSSHRRAFANTVGAVLVSGTSDR